MKAKSLNQLYLSFLMAAIIVTVVGSSLIIYGNASLGNILLLLSSILLVSGVVGLIANKWKKIKSELSF